MQVDAHEHSCGDAQTVEVMRQDFIGPHNFIDNCLVDRFMLATCQAVDVGI